MVFGFPLHAGMATQPHERDKLKRFGLFARLGDIFFPTTGAAVSRYLKTHEVEWDDWEDRIP